MEAIQNTIKTRESYLKTDDGKNFLIQLISSTYPPSRNNISNIAGFTAILGELISIPSIDLVWYRMTIAGLLMYLFIKLTKKDLKVDRKSLLGFLIAGVIIALHWVTFFESINQSNISIALSMFSSGAFFASFIETIFFLSSM